MYTLEAGNRELQAQLFASQTLARKTHARFAAEQAEWESERAALGNEVRNQSSLV